MRQVSAPRRRAAGGREVWGSRSAGRSSIYSGAPARPAAGSFTEGCVLLVPVVVLLQAAAAVAPLPPTGAVTGKVRDGTAQRALTDVTVTEAGRLTSLTDSAGNYRLDGLAPGSHQISFVREGYDTLVIG